MHIKFFPSPRNYLGACIFLKTFKFDRCQGRLEFRDQRL